MQRIKQKVAFLGGLLGMLLVVSPFIWSQDVEKGSVLGAVYDKDGTTPIPGAIVKLKNVRSGEVYESTPTDSQGNFLIEQMESGVYVYGVTSSEGDYNCDGMIGVRIDGSGPAKMTLALNRYEDKKGSEENQEAAGAPENISSEYLVGEVLNFMPKNQMAEVRVVRGTLEKKDRIHVLGKETDFYQKVDHLNLDGSRVKRLFMEQVGYLKTKEDVKEGDLVYLAEQKAGLLGFLAAPCGWAALLGATSISYITYTETRNAAESSEYKK